MRYAQIIWAKNLDAVPNEARYQTALQPAVVITDGGGNSRANPRAGQICIRTPKRRKRENGGKKKVKSRPVRLLTSFDNSERSDHPSMFQPSRYSFFMKLFASGVSGLVPVLPSYWIFLPVR